MLRSFLKYYAIFIICFVGAIVLADFGYSKWLQNNTTPLLDSEFVLQQVDDYCEVNDCIHSPLPFSGISLIASDEIALPSTSLDAMLKGEILQVSSANGAYFYASIEPGYFIELGPVNVAKNHDFWVVTVFYILVSLALLLGLLPLFKDMSQLKNAARSFTKHKDISQFKLKQSTYFQPVYDAVSWMIYRIARLSALKKELSDTLSHELRTSLSRLKFNLASLNEHNQEKIKGWVKEDINEIESLVSEYLSFSKQEHETPLLDFKQQSLKPIIEYHIARLGQFAGKGVSVDFSHAADTKVDERAISRAIKNLIDNALKYATHAIHIQLYTENNSLVFQVDDDGKGVNSTNLDDLFLPYSRADEKQPGYGLGLAITNKIIMWHQGQLKASNSDLLPGACFKMYLPIEP
ncbi:sensor histidine kinase [Thalassotalea agarivorans]|uniref:histidine kinase n=1 Tax=Thalassotalea agarivorans TaxID=349064 RepID=A0A1I0H2W8_THASX|nr:HAMP domain-containing sensor histidine kinase [Thalassotalea agarivorans]SET78042.1 two-component system, OmpR family, sensor kinase [Thalassotalea agarivorans]